MKIVREFKFAFIINSYKINQLKSKIIIISKNKKILLKKGNTILLHGSALRSRPKIVRM